jgi:serine O-acetyltransferase
MTVTRVAANGLEFEVDTWGAGDRLALCLHGFPELGFSWRYQGPLLAELGYRVWAPNLRGYGNSSRPRERAAYAMTHLLDDVAGLIDASGARSVTLLGHDWGAMVAWFFAMRRVRPLERLVIMNVPHPAAFRAALRHLPQKLRSWYVQFFALPKLPEFVLGLGGAAPVGWLIALSASDRRRFGPEVLDVYRHAAAQPGALTAMIDWYRANIGGGGMGTLLRSGIPVIETPTLMLWGEADVALGVDTTYGTERYVRELTLRYLPGVSHWVQQEAPEQVNAMLTAFLRGEPVPSARCADPRDALAQVLGAKLAGPDLTETELRALATTVLHHEPQITAYAADDLAASVERDPAYRDAFTPFAYAKGFHALEWQRIAHALWCGGREDLATYLEGRANDVLAIDIHPGAVIGRGVFIDHGTGIVIGETAVVGDDVSMLHGVTLGGTGKESGDRHPKIGSGVLIGAGATILGNVRVGDGAKVAAGSVVLRPVAPHTTVAGVPAHVVGSTGTELPAQSMDQDFLDFQI